MTLGDLTALPAQAVPHGDERAPQRSLGHGGMSNVFATHDVEHGSVAMKLVRDPHPLKLSCLRNEFEQMGRVRHPNIAAVYGFRETGSGNALIMEHVQGSSLELWLRGRPSPNAGSVVADTVLESGVVRHRRPRAVPLSSPTRSTVEVVCAFLQLAYAIRHLHELGKLHCDLKPSNVMIEDTGRVVLIDFGLVTPIDRSQADREMGTFEYWSPECFEGAPASTASDWYAFGLMLHEALTGWLPLQLEFRRGGAIPPPVRLMCPDANPELASLCDALLSSDPLARLSGEQVVAALRRYMPCAEDGGPDVTPLRRSERFAGSGLRFARQNQLVARRRRTRQPRAPAPASLSRPAS